MIEDYPTQSHEAISGDRDQIPRQRVFVEIGPGSWPVSLFSIESFGPNNRYIGIQPTYQAIDRAVRRADPRLRSEYIDFVEASGEALPLSDQSTDEVFFGDIFGNSKRISQEQLLKFLQEAHRVLRDDGRVTILETYSPALSNDVVGVIRGSGFVVERRLTHRDPEFDQVLMFYKGNGAVKSEMDYFLILKKS